MSTEQTETKYGEFRELPVPDTFPKDGSCAAVEQMRVVQVFEGDEAKLGYHIELSDSACWPDDLEAYWGEHFAEVAWAISHNYSEVPLDTFDKIRVAFLRRVRKLKREARKHADQAVMDMIDEVAAEHNSGNCSYCAAERSNSD